MPSVVAEPATSMFSLTVIGTPLSGPDGSPRLNARSAASAAVSAVSASGTVTAFSSWLTWPIRSRCACTTSRQDAFPAWTSAASSVAAISHSSGTAFPPLLRARGKSKAENAGETVLSFAAASAALPAELGEPVVVDAEMVGDLVDDGAADLARDLVFRAADDADRQAVDRDAVGQHPGVLGGAAGERDTLVEPEQPGRARVVFHGHGDVAHQPAEFRGQAVERRGDHLLEAAGLDVDHSSIVRVTSPNAGCNRISVGRAGYPASNT